jgi:hypothetical protein
MEDASLKNQRLESDSQEMGSILQSGLLKAKKNILFY